jgi:DNA helicase-2/ATP-dependent DNA helicase PcrA
LAAADDSLAISFGFAPGLRVSHPTFGDGLILETQARHHDRELLVNFDHHGQKRLLASMSRLKLID